CALPIWPRGNAPRARSLVQPRFVSALGELDPPAVLQPAQHPHVAVRRAVPARARHGAAREGLPLPRTLAPSARRRGAREERARGALPLAQRERRRSRLARPF